MNTSETIIKTEGVVNERLVDYILVTSLLKEIKKQNLLTFDEYSNVLKEINIKYKDVRG